MDSTSDTSGYWLDIGFDSIMTLILFGMKYRLKKTHFLVFLLARDT